MRKKVSHSDAWWASEHRPPHVLRCTAHYKSTGERCRREALPGTNVCRNHGALIPAVQQAAANRIGLSLDDAVKRLKAMLDDDSVEARERIKILHDLLDRGGLNATQKHLVGVGTVDRVEQLFQDVLGDPAGLVDPHAAPPPALPARDPCQALLDAEAAEGEWAGSRGPENGGEDADDIVDAEVVEDGPAPHTVQGTSPKTPKHIREALERLI